MAGVKSLSGNFNTVSSLCWCLLIVSSHSISQKAKIFLILGISDFQLYPGHLRYCYLTRLWILFILFQQASADAMLVGKWGLHLYGTGWDGGLAPQGMGPRRLYLECSRNCQRGLSWWAALPRPALLGASSSLPVGIPGFQVSLGPRLVREEAKKKCRKLTAHCSAGSCPLFLSTSQSHVGFKIPSRRNRKNVPIPSCLVRVINNF